jgi:hypothetical protein
MREEEKAGGGVVKFTTIIALHTFMVVPNFVATKEKKWARVENVSDLRRRGKVHK